MTANSEKVTAPHHESPPATIQTRLDMNAVPVVAKTIAGTIKMAEAEVVPTLIINASYKVSSRLKPTSCDADASSTKS
jgi:hypothetical protein